ncbi:beta-lactamase/transpeptidase-like protein [Lentinula raphanica]|nr:beta-lactamase/transpeptidase-like protein [Lentinula raphanica]
MRSLLLLVVSLTTTVTLARTQPQAQEQQPFLTPGSTYTATSSNTVVAVKDVLTPQIDEFVEQVLSDWNSAGGVGISVVQRNEDGSWNVEKKGYGIARADGSKVTEDTLFSIGSNSKLFDVLATGLLISNESLSPRIHWNTKISSIIPEWELEDPIATAESTIIDLMSHRTGLPRHDLAYNETQSIESLISQIKHLKPSSSFRETFQYNNIMYSVLSYLPQTLLNIPFAQYVKTHILVPLGMSATTYSGVLAEESGELAEGFGRDGLNRTEDVFGRGVPRAMPYWNMLGGEDGNLIAGAGGVISSARDMATWLQVLLLRGKNPETDEQVIPSSVVDKVATGTTVMSGTPPYPELAPVTYGGGQMRSSYRGFNFIEHGGATRGFRSQVTRFPFSNTGIAVLSNDDMYGDVFMEIIKWRIVDELFGLEAVDWNSRAKQSVKESYETQLRQRIPRPENPTLPSVPFTSLAGNYTHPAYGTIELCGLPSSFPSPTDSESPATETENDSETCKRLLEKISTRHPRMINTSTSDVADPNAVPTFLASFDKIWVSYLRLHHFDGDVFNVSGFVSLPIIGHTHSSEEKYDQTQEKEASGPKPQLRQHQKYWTYDATEDQPFLNIEFDVGASGALDADADAPNGVQKHPHEPEHEYGHGNGHGFGGEVAGFGFTGGLWGAGEGVEGPQGESVRERAEVWFERM